MDPLQNYNVQCNRDDVGEVFSSAKPFRILGSSLSQSTCGPFPLLFGFKLKAKVKAA